MRGMKALDSFITAYIELETQVRQLQADLFSKTCGLCTACCCRVDICEESIQSAFLSLLLKRQALGEEDMADRYGWLDQHGCTLEYGRPPVCYAFFCDELLARLPDDETRDVVRVLGRLMEYIGENAVMDCHLVEIMDAGDLVHADFEALHGRLEIARQLLEVIESFIETGRLDATDRAALEAIGSSES